MGANQNERIESEKKMRHANQIINNEKTIFSFALAATMHTQN